MAGNLEQPVILDFFGLPGCGKSTVSHLLAEELRKQGKTVYEPSYERDHTLSPIDRKVSKIVCFGKYGIHHPVRMFRLIHMIYSVGNKLLSSLALAMIVIVRTSEINSCGNGIIIMDQGIVQLAISICQDSCSLSKVEIVMNEVLKFVSPHKKLQMIHIAVSVDTAMERAENRGTLVSRMDREANVEKKRAIMAYYYDALNQLITSDTVVVDGTNPLWAELDYLLTCLLCVEIEGESI